MKIGSIVALVVLVPLLALANELPDLGDVSQGTLSLVQEKRLGEGIMRQIRAHPAYLDDPEVADYLNGIGYRLVGHSPDPGGSFEFFGIVDGSVNAFALPGGFIGVHSGLILTAQSESELASVLSHEVAHVTQRHLARMVAAQQRSGLASMAALAVAILAARANPEISQAAIVAAQAGSIQSQLNFTREHEREADRIGLQVMEKSGYDVHAMPVFFERLQRATRVYETGAPSYLRTHPLTFERVADVQSRIQGVPYRQVPDSLEFQLVRARLQAREGTPQNAVKHFDQIIAGRKFSNEAAMRYGLTVALLGAGDSRRAQAELATLLKLGVTNPMFDALAAQTLIANGNTEKGLEAYRLALRSHPGRRALIYGYADALITAGRARDATDFLATRLDNRTADPRLYELQARAYADMGRRLLQHQAQAEAYVLRGSLLGAIEQLQIAQRAGDGDFYQQSAVEARLRELIAIDTENRQSRP